MFRLNLPRAKPWRWFILALVGSLPLIFYAVLVVHVSWQPRTLCKGILSQNLSYTSDGKMLIVNGSSLPQNSYAAGLQVWDLSTRQLVRKFESQRNAPGDFVSSTDGRIIAEATDPGMVLLWETATAKRLILLNLPTASMTVDRMLFSPDNKKLVVLCSYGACAGPNNDGRCRSRLVLWDLSTYTPRLLLAQLLLHKFPVIELTFSPDSSLLAGTNWADCYVWSCPGGQLVWYKSGAFAKSVTKLCFSPDSRTLAGMNRTTISMWDARTGRLKQRVPGVHENFEQVSTRLNFTADGQPLAISQQDTSITIISRSGRRSLPHIPRTNWFQDMTISQDNRMLAVADGTFIKLYDMDEGKLLRELNNHQGNVISLSFAPDNNELATADDKGVIKLWRVH